MRTGGGGEEGVGETRSAERCRVTRPMPLFDYGICGGPAERLPVNAGPPPPPTM